MIGVSVLGFTATANYNGPVPDATIAAQLAAGLNAAGSPVSAIVSGAQIRTGGFPASGYCIRW